MPCSARRLVWVVGNSAGHWFSTTQLCHDPASAVSRSCLSCVTILPQLRHDPASYVSRSCLIRVTILPRLCHDLASYGAMSPLCFSCYNGSRDVMVLYNYSANAVRKVRGELRAEIHILSCCNYSANVFQSLLGINFTFGRYA